MKPSPPKPTPYKRRLRSYARGSSRRRSVVAAVVVPAEPLQASPHSAESINPSTPRNPESLPAAPRRIFKFKVRDVEPLSVQPEAEKEKLLAMNSRGNTIQQINLAA
jgi:hypothetical protein